MVTSVKRLAKADQLDDLARQCANKGDRDSYSQTADGWRRNALMAQHQEAWTILHPLG